MEPKPKKYYWTRQEEAQLLELWKSGTTDPKMLGEALGRKPRAIEMKLSRLGVVVVKPKQIKRTPTTTGLIPLGKDLLTHEAALKRLVGALEALRNPGMHA